MKLIPFLFLFLTACSAQNLDTFCKVTTDVLLEQPVEVTQDKDTE
jgi:hypothetical protein